MPARPTRGVNGNGRTPTRGDVLDAVANLRNEICGDNSLKTILENQLADIKKVLDEHAKRLDGSESTFDAHVLQYTKDKFWLRGWAAGTAAAVTTGFKLLFKF